FFVQAEAGIRYWSVTGVQTCALPIWRRARRADAGAPTTTALRRRPDVVGAPASARLARRRGVAARAALPHSDAGAGTASGWGVRSEERRVGEERRTRVGSAPRRR